MISKKIYNLISPFVIPFSMPFDRKTYVIPDGTVFDGEVIKVDGDAVIGNSCSVDFGIEAERFFAGERVKVKGNIKTKGDVRIDLFSSIEGDIICGGNAYIGEGTSIHGKLSLKGDLDVGDNVEITEGFEAKGWINIRSPIPFIIYVFLYLIELLKRGHSEEVERILQEMEKDEMISISEKYLFLPNASVIGNEGIIQGSLQIGKNCKVKGNYKIKGNAFVGEDSTLIGSLKCSGNIILERKAIVEGNVEGNEIIIKKGCTIGGDVRGRKIEMQKDATIGGIIKATDGITFFDEKKKRMQKKVERFAEKADVVDEVAELL